MVVTEWSCWPNFEFHPFVYNVTPLKTLLISDIVYSFCESKMGVSLSLRNVLGDIVFLFMLSIVEYNVRSTNVGFEK